MASHVELTEAIAETLHGRSVYGFRGRVWDSEAEAIRESYRRDAVAVVKAIKESGVLTDD